MSQMLEPFPTFLSRQWKPYPSYERSGEEWLDDIPEHWDVIKLKHICWRVANYGANESSDKYAQDGIRFLRTTDIDEAGCLTPENAVFMDKSVIGDYLLDEGDILLSRSGTIGRSFLYSKHEHGDCSFASYLVRFSCKENYFPKFIFYFTKSKSFFDWLGISVIQSTIGNVSGQKYANLPLTIPPFEEQKSIARFLDRETTCIDTLITKKRQLIALLQKKRAAMVDSFVIKVADPHEAIKKADMSWLNDLPDNWGNVRLKFLSSFITSGSRGWAEYYSDDGSVFLRIGNLSTESIDLDLTDLQFVQPPKGAEGERTRVYPNDLLISITALIGAVGIVPSNLSDAYVNQHTALVRLLDQQIYPRWAAYCVSSSLGQKQLGEFTSGGTKDGLTLSDVGNLLMLIPSDKNQELYVKELDKKINLTQLTILKTKESIETLKKYRTALITAAVTGKIDVHEEVN